MNTFKIRIIQRDNKGRTEDTFDIEVEASNKKLARRVARILHPLPRFTLGKVWNK